MFWEGWGAVMQFLWTWEVDCDFEDPFNSESLMLNKVNIFLYAEGDWGGWHSIWGMKSTGWAEVPFQPGRCALRTGYGRMPCFVRWCSDTLWVPIPLHSTCRGALFTCVWRTRASPAFGVKAPWWPTGRMLSEIDFSHPEPRGEGHVWSFMFQCLKFHVWTFSLKL